jgi:citrate lyase gamma subunit
MIMGTNIREQFSRQPTETILNCVHEVKVRKIEVDVETADLLEARAAERGLSISSPK